MIWDWMLAAWGMIANLGALGVALFAIGWALKAWVGVVAMKWLRLRWLQWKEGRQ